MATRAFIPLDDDLSAETDRDSERGIPIRSVTRAVAVLQAINRNGSLNMMQVAQASNVPYPTACRIVQTLIHEGLIEREPQRKFYRPTAMVQTLSHGYQGDSALVDAARPHITALTAKIGWPVTMTQPVGAAMVLRDSTHSLTTLTFNQYHPGYSIPILACAAGLVYLAFCPQQERDKTLSMLERFGDEDTRHMLHLARDGGLLATVKASGYAARGYNRFTRNPGKTSSIAVPIIVGGAIEGALTVAFFAATIEIRKAVRDLLEPLRECAAAVGREMARTRADAEPARPALRQV
ncbi:helix-turn-helix domain-containing protein [Novosphingobium resinovorum]|uniref:helix-turn-helix domain-containing protein n=1 Tax=Novosphingobium resinovorum TaxID=158500 RepID=UPI002ED25480|nr:helix-turn-helix domain-containing protein [Novosphingobium resinovorum]